MFSLGVSMGSANHRGEALQATVDWLNASSFDSGVIDVSDSLNRYTWMLDGRDAESAHAAARAQGDEWLKTNSHILGSLKKPSKIIRWEEWLADPQYPQIRASVQEVFDGNNRFRMAVYADISNFYARQETQLSPEKVGLSVQYLLEELSAHTLLHRSHPSTAIYPGKQLECYKMVRQKHIEFPEGIPGSAFVRLVPHSFGDRAPASTLLALRA